MSRPNLSFRQGYWMRQFGMEWAQTYCPWPVLQGLRSLGLIEVRSTARIWTVRLTEAGCVYCRIGKEVGAHG